MVRTYDVDDVNAAIEKHDRPCQAVREDLQHCVLTSDCVKIHKNKPNDCLINRLDGCPEECFLLRQLLYECKRSVIDPRARFRGRKGY